MLTDQEMWELERKTYMRHELKELYEIAQEKYACGNLMEGVCLLLIVFKNNYARDEIKAFLLEHYYAGGLAQQKLLYQKNLDRFSVYPYIMNKNFYSFDDATIKMITLEENYYVIFDEREQSFSEVFCLGSERDKRPFFQHLEKQLLIKNEINPWNIKYLWDNVRRSEDFGGDNHIYMYYDSFPLFCLYLRIIDFENYLEDEKFVFLFGEEQLEEYYPLDFKHLFGIDYALLGKKKVRVNEIKRIVFNWFTFGGNGTLFLHEIIDSHPNILCLSQCTALSDFQYIYLKYLHNKPVAAAIRDLKQAMSADPIVQYRGGMGDFVEEREFPKFFMHLASVLRDISIPKKDEWFKGFFLAYSYMIKRDLEQRIAPMIYFHIHASSFYTNSYIESMKDMFESFPYFVSVSTVRKLCKAFGSAIRGLIQYEEPYMAKVKNGLQGLCTVLLADQEYMDADDPYYSKRHMIRFEDLKLYPKATLSRLCEVIDVPWDDHLLQCSHRGILTPNGFDCGTIYHKSEQYVNAFDLYRLEALLHRHYEAWGYRSAYYDDISVYSEDEFVNMFKFPFKFELLFEKELLPEEKEEIQQLRENLYGSVRCLAKFPLPMSKDKTARKPIQWLKPKPELMNGDLFS